MHIAEYVTDDENQLVDVVYACSDFCHRGYCETEGVPYDGWDGCHEGPDYVVACGYYGETINPERGGEDA